MARFLRTLAILSILILAIIPVVVSATTWTYNTTGSHNWTAPANTTKIRLFMVGGGGGGHPGNMGYGANGGSPGYVVNLSFLSVTPGTYYPLNVGTGGANKTGSGGYTDIGSNSGTVTSGFGMDANGGPGGTYRTSGAYGTDGGAGYRSTTKFSEDGSSNGGNAGGIGGTGFGAGGGGGAYTWDGGTGLGGFGAGGYIEITSLNTTEGDWPDFSASPTSGSGGTLIKFTNLSIIHETTNLTFLWDFGDGGTSNTTGDVNHVYSYTGIYTVSLTISSDYGEATEIKKDYITITSVNYYDPNAPPKSVRFHIQTIWGKALPGATVSAIGIGTSTGNWDWVETLLSIPLSSVGINTTPMVDTTDSNGNIVFLMVPSVKYNITTTLSGYSFPPFYVTPQDSQYNIVADLNGTGWWGPSGNNSLEQYNISVTSTKLTDTVGQIVVNFTDISGSTIGGNITIAQDNTTVRGGPDEVIVIIPITSSSMNESQNVTIPQEGGAYKVFVNPYGAEGPDIKAIRSFAVWFKGHPISFAGFSPTILLWFSMFLIIFLAMFAGATHAPQMAVILCITSWVLYGMGWLDPIETNLWVGTPVLVFTLGFATIMAIWWNLREGKRKETGR